MVAVAGGTGPVGKSLTQGLVGEGGQLRSECLDEARVATLRDGSTVLLRRLDAADIDAVIALHDALSDHERYLRFFTPRPPYLKTCARKLTERSDKDYALGAFESGELIGVANYVVFARSGNRVAPATFTHRSQQRNSAFRCRRFGRESADA